MKRRIDVIYILLFLTIIFVPLFLTNNDKKVNSALDNRKLAEFPEFGEVGFENAFENYLEDRIGLRDEIVSGYQWVNYVITGELTHPVYTFGRDGYTFFTMRQNIDYGLYHQTFADAVIKMSEYCESRGVPFYFMLDPEKASVYRRYLPEGVNYNDNWCDRLLDYLIEHGVKVVNNKDLLLDRSYDEQVFNRQYDAGHWNDLGCFYATNNLWSVINKDFPAVTEVKEEEYIKTKKIEEYLGLSKLIINDDAPVLSIKDKYNNITSLYNGIERIHPFFDYLVNSSSDANKYPRALVFHGSYYNRKPQFFVPRTREYIGVHDYQNVINLDYYFGVFQPDIVVFETAEYTISNEYYSFEKMKEIEFNPSVATKDSFQQYINNIDSIAKRDISMDSADLFRIQDGGLDIVYIDKELIHARYAYLLSSDGVFDLKINDRGFFQATTRQGALDNSAILLYEDYSGNMYYSYLNLHGAKRHKDAQDMICSQGTEYNNDDHTYTIQSVTDDNAFNSLDIQILDGRTHEYLQTIVSTNVEKKYDMDYIHKLPDGFYIIHLKGNGSKRDEGTDIGVYLIGGNRYQISFNINKFSEKKIIISNYEFYGPEHEYEVIEKLIGYLDLSQGVQKNDQQYELRTYVEDNSFNSVVIQLQNEQTGEYLDPIVNATVQSQYGGIYIHSAKSGMYYYKIRANSNKRDEYVGKSVYLEEGKEYLWRANIECIEPHKVVLSEILLGEVGE